jgi:1,2-phenylacetyl-CoA epoxidase PaaB subunit
MKYPSWVNYEDYKKLTEKYGVWSTHRACSAVPIPTTPETYEKSLKLAELFARELYTCISEDTRSWAVQYSAIAKTEPASSVPEDEEDFCDKCGKPTHFAWYEVEIHKGTERIKQSFLCDNCWYRLRDYLPSK